MKDINTMFLDAMDIMKDLNIEVKPIISVRWNPKLHTVWGRCIKDANTYRIELNSILNDNDVSWDAAMNTIIHEVLHAHPNRFCHTGEWKRCALLINREYPHYNIERTTSAEEKGVANKIQTSYKYIITCNRCGAISKYKSNSKIVKLVRNHSNSCTCNICGCTEFTLTEY